MSTRRTAILITHALGWMSLLATAGAGRLGLLGGGGHRSVLLLGLGGLTFVVLVAWSGAELLTRLEPTVEERAQPRTVGAPAAAPARVHSHLVRSYGRTTIRPSADLRAADARLAA